MAARKVQEVFRAKQARKALRTRRASIAAEKEETATGEHKTWIKIYDPQSKADYWFNNETQESSWDPPEGTEEYKKQQEEKAEKNLPVWVKIYDPHSIAYYYSNNYTHEAVWEEPEDYVEPPKGVSTRLFVCPGCPSGITNSRGKTVQNRPERLSAQNVPWSTQQSRFLLMGG